MSNTKSPQSKPGFSFANLLSPKTSSPIKFNEQPKQSGVPPTPKKSGLEAYARKGRDPLPVGFAEQLLECEMQFVLDEISIETVNKLTELYSIGMVYYEPETTNKYKYQYFANKLQELMLKPLVKEAMLRSMSDNKTAQQDKELRRMRLEDQVSRVDSDKEAFTLVKSHEHKEKEINKVLEGDLSSQKDRMKKRLAERKARSQSRPQSVTYSEENSSTTEEAIQELEKELEGLPSLNKRDLQDIEEVDEARYSTPPRRRSKNGLMIFYNKGRKSSKPTEPQQPLTDRGMARRQSFNVEQVTTAIIAKRVGRASSFGNMTGPPGLNVVNRIEIAPLELKKKQEIVQEQKESDSSTSSEESRTEVKEMVVAEVKEPTEAAPVVTENEAHASTEVQSVNNETAQDEQNQTSEVVAKEEVPNQAVETEQSKEEVQEQQTVETVAEEQQVEDNKAVDAPTEAVDVAQGENVPEPVELEVSPEKTEAQQTEEPVKTVEEEQVQTQQEVVEAKQEETQAEPVPVAEESQSEQVEAPKVEEQKEEAEHKEEAEVAVTKERRESEVADEERLALLKQIEEEQKVLLEEFVQKQEAQKEEVRTKTEAKYKQKREAMEDDMDDDEKSGMMWQKVLAKMEKDKEDEIQKGLEKMGAEHGEELEKYKKKLQQQKMFKLAELSD